MTISLLVGCNRCGGVGFFNENPRHVCLECNGVGSWTVDATTLEPYEFLDFYGSRKGRLMPEAADDVTAFLMARGWTWHDVGEAAPDWLVLPEGPSKLDFEEETRERGHQSPHAGPGPSKAWPRNVIPFRRTA